MNRFQKKCFIISAGLHLLLAVMLVAGSAFLSAGAKKDNTAILDFIPSNLIPIEGNVSGGGGPAMRPPSPQPPVVQPPAEPPTPPPQAQQPVVRPPPEPRPQPKTEVVKTPTPEPQKIVKSPDAIEVPKPQKHQIVVNMDLVTSSSKDKQKAKEAADKTAKEAVDKQKKLAALFDHVTSNIRSGTASGTDIKFNAGFGGNGPAYASWLSIIKTIYYNDWSQRVSDGVTDDSAIGVASVTIAKDGTVLSATLKQSSGSKAVDRSIQSTLDRVRFTHAFPETSKEEQTTLEIYFSVKALKQLMG